MHKQIRCIERVGSISAIGSIRPIGFTVHKGNTPTVESVE